MDIIDDIDVMTRGVAFGRARCIARTVMSGLQR